MNKNNNKLERVNLRINILRSLVKGVGKGSLRGLIVSGSHGIGKSHNTIEVLSDIKNINTVQFRGHITPLELYHTLGDNSDSDSVIVFDDADSVFTETKSLNILKAATDTNEKRVISWGSSSTKIKYPNFVYEGKIIILTNHNVKLTAHYRAFISRVHYIDLTFTVEEILAKISDLAETSLGLEKSVSDDVSDWIHSNSNRLDNSSISLRTFILAAELALEFGKDMWKDIAELTILEDIK